MLPPEPEKGKQTAYAITSPDLLDSINLYPVLERWIQWKGEVLWDEIELVQKRLRDSISGYIETKYFVLTDENQKAIGIFGLTPPTLRMLTYKSSPEVRALELINFYLDDTHRGKGLGRMMFEHARKSADQMGADEIIWNSGERYKDSAYGFYNHVAGEPVIIAEGYYGSDSETGKRYDALVWRMSTLKG